MKMNMEIFNADRERSIEINNLLQRIKYKADKLQSGEEYVYFSFSLVKSGKFRYLESVSNQVLFQELESWGVIEIMGRDAEEMNKTLKESAQLKNKPLIVEGYFIKPVEPKFSQLCRKYEALAQGNKRTSEINLLSDKGQRNSLIQRNADGDFYYKDKLIKLESKDTIYYLIFECLFEEGDLADGFCSYETIDRYLVKHGQEEYADGIQVKNRIKNGIMNLFRFSQLPRKAPNGKDLIRRRKGEGVMLYNPKL